MYESKIQEEEKRLTQELIARVKASAHAGLQNLGKEYVAKYPGAKLMIKFGQKESRQAQEAIKLEDRIFKIFENQALQNDDPRIVKLAAIRYMEDLREQARGNSQQPTR